MKRVSFLVCMICLFTSCHPFFCIWSLGYDNVRKMSRTSLYGLYTLDKHSLNQMHYEGKYTIAHHSLELKPDGTYKFINAPDWMLNPFGVSSRSFFDNEGGWTYTSDSTGCSVTFNGFKYPPSGNIGAKRNNLPS